MDFGNSWRNMPPVTKNLILINLLIWLAGLLVRGFGVWLQDHLGLHMTGASMFNPVQVITYMFLHDITNPLHVLFNMFTLWMFGRIMEQVWGSRRFFVFYMVCGIGAALVQELVWALTFDHEYVSHIARINGLTVQHAREIIDAAIANGDPGFINGIAQSKNMMVTVGASGAVFGLLLGFAMTFPNMPMYLFFIPVPIKAKYMVIGYAVLEFFLGVNGGGTIAHFAHLGGMLFGFILLIYWKKKGTLHGGGYY